MSKIKNLSEEILQQTLNYFESFSKSKEEPFHFINPVYPGSSVAINHTKNNPKQGGFFGIGRGRMHYGIDIKAKLGSPLYASESGTVVLAEKNLSAYGQSIYIQHGERYQSRYAHLSDIKVKTGQKVRRGELIGFSGKSGNASASEINPHLHFEIREMRSKKAILSNQSSKALDPLKFIQNPDSRKQEFIDKFGPQHYSVFSDF